MTTKVTKHYFQYGAHKYFRTSAHEVKLLSIGEKKDPIGPKAYLAVSDHIWARHLADERITVTPPVTIDWNNTSSVDFDTAANIRYLGVGVDVSQSLTLARARSAQLKLVSFSLPESAVERILNTEADILRREMADEGRDARVVTEVWVAMEAQLANSMTIGALNTSDISYAGNNVRINVNAGGTNSSVITLGEGTTFAYRLHKVRKWNKGKTRIEDLEDDYVGMN
ncbi:hypothetical protein [Jannaschia pohangensis]|uniref:Uncharacterized protein n=1 Tax=Jannaschia pohangensis TaxID=390807 RepID=A0A1I3IAY2_9RHOB|nr:hypothetical protein [Jannaschia pohangensis]SFI45059.1 hypothetical protein SAMN04488095_0886 [Jannaschia pohangensis]